MAAEWRSRLREGKRRRRTQAACCSGGPIKSAKQETAPSRRYETVVSDTRQPNN